jgi:hypothetical protein
MNKVGLKLEKVLKIMSIGLLIGMSVLSSIQVGRIYAKSKVMITSELADSADTIIAAQERFRGRVFFDILKKVMFIASAIPSLYDNFQPVNSNGLTSLFVNAYQRNVFYVYAVSTVP